ncbi:MAG: ATP-binding cassette domain-containing protein [Planctomycetes bacterium]|nr:ATP-binding cassette domain-containing protein [Planctomycetota bacterium]
MTTLDVLARRQVSKEFLLDADFEIAFEDALPVAALFGPTGCGKSTTLAAVAGVPDPDRGRIAIGEEVLFDWNRNWSLPADRRRVGWVPQDGLLFPHLTVEANLRYGMRRRGAEEAPSFDRVVAVLEAGPLLARSPASLSGGERQRAALGRAILSGPRLLLLDEPVSALDEAARLRALAFLERVAGEFRIPALFVSHQRTEVLRLARTVVRMEGGRAVETGPAAEVLGHGPIHGSVDNLLRLEPPAGGPAPGRAAVSGREVAVAEGAVVAGPCWARLPSAAVLLARHAPTDLSARNALPGRVLAVAAAGPVVRVHVDAGQAVCADLTEAAVRDLGIAPGAEVVCVFKAQALEVLP